MRPEVTGAQPRREPAAGSRTGPRAHNPMDVFHLPALGACVAEARRRLRTLLAARGVEGEVGDDAGLILSELFTNAVRYSDSTRIACALRVTTHLLRLEVADQGRGASEPHAKDAAFDEEGGRGLLLVDALAQTWGVHPCADGHGRVVWAVLSREPRGGQD
ncbi:regulatory protein [Streptantibioticus cattleyicolor NRRL 8057 = DSM 46488]|uniref:Regulatory protein n=2 Tax=Kitasatosporales TaxID=85011 RepID=G8X0S9_STREN|nr:ATP-binding protein [Streptomyces sp. SID5468]AEW97319.1 regulatory protein [Streptantibioticus cattleyicolor NRRL 8057 = DSM 46488]